MTETGDRLPANWIRTRRDGEHLVYRRVDFEHYVAVRKLEDVAHVVLMTDVTDELCLPLESTTTSPESTIEAVMEFVSESNSAIPP